MAQNGFEGIQQGIKRHLTLYLVTVTTIVLMYFLKNMRDRNNYERSYFYSSI